MASCLKQVVVWRGQLSARSGDAHSPDLNPVMTV
jgi:hypothetical protein